ncbi:hypothetical protein BS78_05G248900 [Paspalum vaginatum]|nr:hypothetical protein BS78_05G248900 [Paspalum vaginatum]
MYVIEKSPVCTDWTREDELVRETASCSVSGRSGHGGAGDAEDAARGPLEESTWRRNRRRSSSSRESRKIEATTNGTRPGRAGMVAGGRGSWRAGCVCVGL